MIEHFSPEGRAAILLIKNFIRENVSIDALEERALMLAGLPQAEVNAGVGDFCSELTAAFEGELSEHLRVAFTVASAEIVCERIAGIQATGSGRA